MKKINPALNTAFSISPNPTLLYQTPALKAAIYQARQTIDNRQGLVALFSDVGLGKTTVMNYLHSDYATREDVLTVQILTPQFTSTFAMIKEICATFDLPAKRSLLAQQNVLEEFLAAKYLQENKNIVIFIDEAQMLKDDLLDGIRSFLNFEKPDAKLVQVVLGGQIELKTRLYATRFRALRSRIDSEVLISPLADFEMREMFEFRCAQCQVENPLNEDAVNLIWKLSKGIPRHALKIAGKVMGYVHLTGADISSEMIHSAAEDSAVIDLAEGENE